MYEVDTVDPTGCAALIVLVGSDESVSPETPVDELEVGMLDCTSRNELVGL